MSGGYWNYKQRSLAEDLYGWRMTTDYGDDAHEQAKQARKINPFGNKEASELIWDVLCLIHAKDWDLSGDTSNAFDKDWEFFKNKWFNRTDKDRIDAIKSDLKDYYDELIKELDTIN